MMAPLVVSFVTLIRSSAFEQHAEPFACGGRVELRRWGADQLYVHSWQLKALAAIEGVMHDHIADAAIIARNSLVG
jgi:hypothetical protein